MRRLILVLLLFFLPRYTNPDHWNSKSSGLKSKAPKGQPPAPKPSKGISHNHHHYIEKDAIHDQPDYKPNDLDFRHPPLLISLHSKMSKAYPEGLKSIEFCKNCEDPFRNGSQIRGLTGESHSVSARLLEDELTVSQNCFHNWLHYLPHPICLAHFTSLVSLVFTAAQGPKDYSIQSDLVYAVPNDGRERLLNAHELEGRIVLFDRGEISLVEKVLKAQAEGASGGERASLEYFR